MRVELRAEARHDLVGPWSLVSGQRTPTTNQAPTTRPLTTRPLDYLPLRPGLARSVGHHGSNLRTSSMRLRKSAARGMRSG